MIQSVSRFGFLMLSLLAFKATAMTENEKWAKGFNAPGTNNLITALDADQQYIYATGLFNRINGGNSCYKLAKYNGTEWTTFIDSLNGPDFPMEIKVRNGVIWVADTKGLLRYNGSWQLVANTNNQPVYDFDFDVAGNIYMVGAFTSINGSAISGVAKYNGSSWSSLGTGINVSSSNQARAVHCMSGQVYIAGPFTSVSGINCNGFAKWNGSAWSSLNTGGMILSVSTHFAEFNNQLYLSSLSSTTGFNQFNRVFKYDGSTLVQLGGNFDSDIYHLRFVNNKLYVTGNFNLCGSTPVNHLAYWNGTSWTDDGTGLNFTTYDIAATAACTLVGGAGTNFGSSYFFQNAAVWRLNKWMPTGNGVNGNVNALLVDGQYVYAAGSFTDAGGLTGRVMRWDGLQWDTLNGGLTIRVVRDMAIFRDTLYIGGNFTDPQTLGGRYLAKWNGSQWVEIPGDVNSDVYALEVYNNELYIGGAFTSMGSGPANQIVKYNGTTWTNLSSMTNNTVKDIKFDQNGIMYVGGGFTTIGGLQARRIARYDGTAWSEVGSGVDNFVNAIGISPNNDVYIGGQFYLGNNVGILNHFAKINGTTLQSVNGGIGSFSDNVYNIQFLCGKMYATGVFRVNNNDTLNHIAVNDGSGWQSLGDGLVHDTTVNAAGLTMAVQNNRLWVGGNFSFAGGSRSDKIACYGTEGIPQLNLNTLNGSTCIGDTLTMVFHGENLGTTPQYQWYINNTPVINNDSILLLPSANDGDEIYVVVTTDPVCGIAENLQSPSYIVHFTNLSTPSVNQNGSTYTVTNPDPLANYIWQVWNGSAWMDITPAVTGNSYQTTTPGQYRVRGAKGTCIRFSTPVVITSLQEMIQSGLPFCTPNPAHSTIQLSQTEGYKEVLLTDISGRVIMQEQLLNEHGKQLSVAGLPAGVYIVRVSGENKTPVTLQLVKE
ncbi:MAG: T9SS type A sorting domain-containing protein [Bacteroidia bacterium]